MVRLTVLYNLHPDVDEEEFLEWRLTEHQKSNMSSPTVLRSDFGRIDQGWPEEVTPKYKFMTTADFPDMESFRESFYDPDSQARLRENVKLLSDPLFLVSEILINEAKGQDKT
jgi:hypothetical protein